MDEYQASAVFHYAPGRYTGVLTTRHENQSLFLILLVSLPFQTPNPQSCLPARLSPCLLASNSFLPPLSISPATTTRPSYNEESCSKITLPFPPRTEGKQSLLAEGRCERVVVRRGARGAELSDKPSQGPPSSSGAASGPRRHVHNHPRSSRC